MFDLKVGFSCNNNCVHCVVGGKRETKDLTLSEIKAIIDTVTPGENIQLTGGEISIRKDFLDIVKYCAEKGHRVAIQTNGTGFADRDLTEQIVPYADSILLALHSVDPDVHNKIVNCHKSESMYEKTMQGFDNLLEVKAPLEIQTVLSSWNIETLYDTYAFIQRKCPGIFMHLTYPHPMGNAYSNHEIVVPKFTDIYKYLLPCIRDFGQYLVIEALPPCFYPAYYQSIEVLIDEQIKKNLVVRHGFDKANRGIDNGFIKDYNYNDLSTKVKSDNCSRCYFNSICAGVWQEYKEFYPKLDLYPLTEVDNRFLDEVYIEYDSEEDVLEYLKREPIPEPARIILAKKNSIKFSELKSTLNKVLQINKELKQTYPSLSFDLLSYREFLELEDLTKEEISELNQIKWYSLASDSTLKLISYIYKSFYIQGFLKFLYLDLDLEYLEVPEIVETLENLAEFQDLVRVVRLIPGEFNLDYLDLKLSKIKELFSQLNNNLNIFNYPLTFINISLCQVTSNNLCLESDLKNFYFHTQYSLRKINIYEDEKEFKQEYSSTIVNPITNCQNCFLHEKCFGITSDFIKESCCTC